MKICTYGLFADADKERLNAGYDRGAVRSRLLQGVLVDAAASTHEGERGMAELRPPGISLSDLVVIAGTLYQRLVERGELDVLSARRLAEQRQLLESLDIAPQFDYAIQ